MKTTERIITEMEKLPPSELREILQHFKPEKEFSDEVIRQLLQAKKDDEQGINMSGPFRGKEATDFLMSLEEGKEKAQA